MRFYDRTFKLLTSPQAHSHFHESGFVIFNAGFMDSELDAAREFTKNNTRHGSGRINEQRRVQDAWRDSPAIFQIATNQEVLGALRMLLGHEFFPFQTLDFDIGSEQRLHQDVAHFCAWPFTGMAAAWVALEDIGQDSGPLCYVPGSHLLAPVFPDFYGVDGSRSLGYADYDRYEDRVEALVMHLDLPVETICLPRGYGFIWHPLLIHGGSRRTNLESTRFSQVTHYFATDCLYFTPLLSSYLGPKAYRVPWNILKRRRVGIGKLLIASRKAGVPLMELFRGLVSSSRRRAGAE